MKREIKFRGQRIDTKEKEWVYGLPAYGSGGNYNKICGWMGDDSAEQYAEIEVNPKTIGEFTGLQDKNGKDIYDGDVLTGWKKGSNSDRGYTGCVEWSQEQCGFTIRCHKFCIEILSLAMSGDGEITRLDSFGVIGNIYENGDLLTPVI